MIQIFTQLFIVKLPIDLASAFVGFLLALILYLLDKNIKPKIEINQSDSSNLQLNQGKFKSLNLEIYNRRYTGILSFLNRSITQARIILSFQDYPSKATIGGMERIIARWNSSKEPVTPDYHDVDIGLALTNPREVVVPGEKTTISIAIKKEGWTFCYPFNNESYIYQKRQPGDFKKPGWEIRDDKFYVEVYLESAELQVLLGKFIVLNKNSLEQFKISKAKT